jgi:hypothetical protein
MRVSFSQPVQNGVVEVRVSPALLCPGASLAWVAGIDGDEHAPPEDELAVAMVQNAGEPLTVCVLPQDALGNMAQWSAQVKPLPLVGFQVSQHHLHHVDESTPTAPHCL